MSYSVNTRPLLENESGSENEDESSSADNGANSECCRLPEEPRDWYKLGFVTFYLLGVVTLLPYTFFVTAHDYWMYKLRNVSVNEANQNMTTLQAEFTSYITIAATAPSVLFMFLNSMYAHRISLELRMFGSLGSILASFIVTTVLVCINSDSWQNIFFAVTIVTVVVINVMGAILQAGLLGIACKISTRYISAVVSGQALGGIFPAIVYIGALSVGASSTHSALLYFNIANFFVALSLIAYYYMSQSLFFKFHLLVKAPANTLTYDPADGAERDGPLIPQISVIDVFKKMWVYAVSAMLCYVITIAVYPSITVLVSSVSQADWAVKYFVPVVAFLVFSIWDYVGRLVAGKLKWPLEQPWVTFALTVVRVFLIPLFLLCNAHPRHHLPVLIHSDIAYVAITCLFGLTNGYMTNNILINAPRLVGREEQEVASSLAALFISIGCAAGAFFSIVCLRIM